MSNLTPYIGRKISLITKDYMRYEATLHSVSPADITIVKVRSFGTEDRVANYMAPRDELHDHMVLRTSDIKDLRIIDPPQNIPPSSSLSGGPLSVPAGPLSVPGGPLSVPGGPLSIPGGPLSAQGGPQSANPQSVGPPMGASRDDKNDGDSQIPATFSDPLVLSKRLIAKDLRQSFCEMNRRAGELLKGRGEEDDERSDVHYTQSFVQFMGVCDQIEQSLTMVMETNKQLQKLERVFMHDSARGQGDEHLQKYIDSTETMTANIERTVSGVFDMVSKLRKREEVVNVKNETEEAMQL